MACVKYFEYFCGTCDELLIKNCDIVDSTSLWNKTYIFVKRETDINRKVHVVGSNILKCVNCHTSLGGMVYRTLYGEDDLVRFCRHLLNRRTVEITIYRNVDETSEEKYVSTIFRGSYQSFRNH